MSADWHAPEVEVTSPPQVAGERAVLEGWLDTHRQTLQWKCSGLDAEQLARRALPPSAMSLHGLVRHMVEVERWCRINAAQLPALDYEFCTDEDQDADWNGVDSADAEADLATYRAEIAASDVAVAAIDLDTVVPGLEGSDEKNVRWIYVHMVEEYARHNGHADLLREAIDGSTGDWP